MSLCENCADKMCYGYSRSISECKDFIPQTNADRIRAMTDEEMADFLGNIDCGFDGCFFPKNRCGKGLCSQCWLNWLKQEVKDD